MRARARATSLLFGGGRICAWRTADTRWEVSLAPEGSLHAERQAKEQAKGVLCEGESGFVLSFPARVLGHLEQSVLGVRLASRTLSLTLSIVKLQPGPWTRSVKIKVVQLYASSVLFEQNICYLSALRSRHVQRDTARRGDTGRGKRKGHVGTTRLTTPPPQTERLETRGRTRGHHNRRMRSPGTRQLPGTRRTAGGSARRAVGAAHAHRRHVEEDS
eukprot:1988344-Prymnesium_polylepis.1